MFKSLSLATLAVLLLVLAGAADARRCDGKASGWTIDGSSTGAGSNCFGRFAVGGAGELEEFDEANPVFCDFDEVGFPRGIELRYLELRQVLRYRNGDLSYSELDTSIPSTLCLNFTDLVSFTFEVHSVITGGTGRFEGASGYSTSRGSGTILGEDISANSSRFEGETFLARSGDHDDDDDDGDDDD